MAKNKDNIANNNPLSHRNLPIPVRQETIDDLVAEGMKLLEKEEKTPVKDDSKNLESKLGETSENPYVRARVKILSQMKPWQRSEIEEMEKSGNTDNRFFDEFVGKVATLGDKFSDNH